MSETTYRPLPTVEQFLKDYAATGLVPLARVTLKDNCGCPLGAYAQARANEGDETWQRAVKDDLIVNKAQDVFGLMPTGGFLNGFDYPSDDGLGVVAHHYRNDPVWMSGREHGKAVYAAAFGGVGSRPAGDG